LFPGPTEQIAGLYAELKDQAIEAIEKKEAEST